MKSIEGGYIYSNHYVSSTLSRAKPHLMLTPLLSFSPSSFSPPPPTPSPPPRINPPRSRALLSRPASTFISATLSISPYLLHISPVFLIIYMHTLAWENNQQGMEEPVKNAIAANGYGVADACKWYEEEIDDDLKWSFALNSVLHKGTSKYQDIALIDTKHFGKALVIDGKMQSAEIDEFIYHECLIHPSLLCHPNPKTVFIMGGGEGSAAREVLKHKTIQRVVMCDIDEEVVEFCRMHLTVNRGAFASDKLCLVINDARAELEKREEKYDVIVGDLADPVEGGPCFQLYTKTFYDQVVKPKLHPHGIFVTQAGPAGVLTHKEVFSSIHNTLKHVFKYVLAYTAHVPSFADTWGWVMASDQEFVLDAHQMDERINARINGELRYLNGDSLVSATTMNKSVYTSLLKETHVYTEESARFIYGQGIRACYA